MIGRRLIHKFPLQVGGQPTVVNVPRSAVVVLVGPWSNPMAEGFAIWFEIPVDGADNYCSPVERTFEVYATGQVFPGGREHVGSFRAGDYILHVYENVR